jgi:hypothetical protein
MVFLTTFPKYNILHNSYNDDMNTRTLLMFAAIAALALGTVGVVAVQPASATFTIGDVRDNNQNDQSSCEGACENRQNNQVGAGQFNDQSSFSKVP